MKKLLWVLFLISPGFAFIPDALAGHHPLFVRGYQPDPVVEALLARPESENVSYFGGPVISKPKVIAVFWGDKINADVKSKIGPFYKGLVDSSYLDWMTVYNTPTQTIGRGTFAGVFTIQPKNPGPKITQTDVEAELLNQIDLGKLPTPDADSLYMIHFPIGSTLTIPWGISCRTWCADHEFLESPKYGKIYFAMMPDVAGCFGNCGSQDLFESVTYGASHEFAEAVTDPACPKFGENPGKLTGWATTRGEEIGDLCVEEHAELTVGTTKYHVEGEWDNAIGRCNIGPFHSP